MSNDFFARLDAATDYAILAEGLYGGTNRMGTELWLVCPYDPDTPKDKFSINAIDGRWRNHKTSEGGSFTELIRKTHPKDWRDAWAKIIPAAAAIFSPGKSGDAGPSGSDAQSEGATAPDKKKSWREIMEVGRKRQNVADYQPFVDAYKIPADFLATAGLWTNQGGRLGPDMRLLFPVYDPSTGELSGIKMRCVNPVLRTADGTLVKSKNMAGLKAGMIGWENAIRNPNRPVLVVEGEKDWVAAAYELKNDYVVLTNSNGAGTWKAEWSKALAKRDVILCYDEDNAGNEGVRKAAFTLTVHAKSVRIAHLGTPDKDVFVWLRHDKEGVAGPGLEAFKSVLNRAEVFDPAANPGEIDAFIKTNCQDEEAEPNTIADVLYKCMSDNGAMFNQVDDREAFCTWRGKVYEVTPTDPWWQSLVYSYTGKDAGSSEGFRVHRHLQMLAITRGKPVESTTWFARRESSLYLPLYGADQKMVEVSPKEITVVPNGYNDVVLMPVPGIRQIDFLEDRRYDSVKAEATWQTMIGMLNCDNSFRSLVSAAVLAIPFYDWCETHPLLRFQGSTGSGKSFATKIITTLLYGQPENQGGDTMAALYRMAGSRMLLALDNMEDTNLIRVPELRDLILRAASGMTRAKSARESERAVVAQRVNCWIMSTGKSPIGVGYEDMEERLVVIPMGGHAQTGFGGTAQLKWVQDNRAVLYSYFLRKTQQTLLALEQGEQLALLRRFPPNQRPRLQEWYSILAVSNGDRGKPSDATLRWLDSAYEGEKSSVIESDPVIALLMRAPGYLANTNTNQGFESVQRTDNGAVFTMTSHSAVLHALLSRISKDCGLPYRIPSAKSLGYHLRSLSRRSSEYGFSFEQRDSQTRMAGTGIRAKSWFVSIHLDAIRAMVGESAIIPGNSVPRDPGDDSLEVQPDAIDEQAGKEFLDFIDGK